MIGHTKCAAGLAGVIKATMAIHHKVRPPTLNISTLNEAYQAEKSPFCFERSARPWLSFNGPRMAGVSAFGFGGTNFHTVLKEDIEQTATAKARKSWAKEPIILFASSENEARQKAEELSKKLSIAKARKRIDFQIRSLAYTLFKEAEHNSKVNKSDLQAYALFHVVSLEEAIDKLNIYASGQEDKHHDIVCLNRFEKTLERQIPL